ncbi:MAG: hypothetical protein JNM18_26505 [Planctomycetaceae bacterium]|nr:hypothetical protein [Planctomycetaceae bacterium]
MSAPAAIPIDYIQVVSKTTEAMWIKCSVEVGFDNDMNRHVRAYNLEDSTVTLSVNRDDYVPKRDLELSGQAGWIQTHFSGQKSRVEYVELKQNDSRLAAWPFLFVVGKGYLPIPQIAGDDAWTASDRVDLAILLSAVLKAFHESNWVRETLSSLGVNVR